MLFLLYLFIGLYICQMIASVIMISEFKSKIEFLKYLLIPAYVFYVAIKCIGKEIISRYKEIPWEIEEKIEE